MLAALALWQPVGPVAPVLFSGDGDVGRHVRVGWYILQTGSIPRQDLFSHTLRGTEFVPYEWLSEVAFAAFHAWAGLAGVALLTGLLFAGTTYLVYRTIVRNDTDRIVGVTAALYCLFLQGIHLRPRPHLFTTFLAALFLLLLLEHRRTGRARSLLALPPLMLLWANLHGGFLVGLIVIGAFLFEALVTRRTRGTGNLGSGLVLAITTAACLAATLVNPAGAALLGHVTGYLSSEYMAERIVEYGSPNFHYIEGQVFLAGIVVSLAVLMLQRSRVCLIDSLMVTLWTAAALYAIRNVPLYAVLAVPFVASWASDAVRRMASEPDNAWRRMAARVQARSLRMSELDARFSKPVAPAILFSAILLWTLVHREAPRYAFSRETFPVDALAAARAESVAGHLFNEFHWGGYLLYDAFPDVPVFIDGQVDFYGERLFRDYYTIRNAEPGWPELLDRYGVGWTLTASQAPLNSALAEEPGWRLVHRDEVATVYARAQGPAVAPRDPR